MGQQVDHVGNHILGKKRDEFFWWGKEQLLQQKSWSQTTAKRWYNMRRYLIVKKDLYKYYFLLCLRVSVNLRFYCLRTVLLWFSYKTCLVSARKTLWSWKLTLSEGVLFDVLSADRDVFEEALSGVGTALLHRVLGTQSKNSQVLQRQQQFDERQVQLLCKDLSDLIALILSGESSRVRS